MFRRAESVEASYEALVSVLTSKNKRTFCITHNITHFFNKLLTKRSKLKKRDKTVKTAQKHYKN